MTMEFDHYEVVPHRLPQVIVHKKLYSPAAFKGGRLRYYQAMTRYILMLLGVGVLISGAVVVRNVAHDKVDTATVPINDTTVATSAVSTHVSATPPPTSGSYTSAGVTPHLSNSFAERVFKQSNVPTHARASRHRGTGKAEEQISGFDAVADKYGFIVAYPDANGSQWVPSGQVTILMHSRPSFSSSLPNTN
jgi:hypothetical protein